MVDLGDREPRRGPYLSQSLPHFCFLKTWEIEAVLVQHGVLVSTSELEYPGGLDGLLASGSFSVRFIFIIGSTQGEKCDLDWVPGSEGHCNAFKRQPRLSRMRCPWGEGDLQDSELSWAPLGSHSLSLFCSLVGLFLTSLCQKTGRRSPE